MPSTWRSRLLVGLAVAAAAVGLFFGMRALSDGDPSTADPSPSASSSPSPEPTEVVEQPQPFSVKVLAAVGEAFDSSNMYGRAPAAAPNNVRSSSRRAAQALDQYLNKPFVGPPTRGTPAALNTLLSTDARKVLGPRDRRALGVGIPRIVGGTTVSANARALVLYEGTDAYAATLRYTAIMDLVLEGDRTQRMTQAGTMVLRPTKGGPWRADMVDVRLMMRPLRSPAPRPSASESEPVESGSEGGTS